MDTTEECGSMDTDTGLLGAGDGEGDKALIDAAMKELQAKSDAEDRARNLELQVLNKRYKREGASNMTYLKRLLKDLNTSIGEKQPIKKKRVSTRALGTNPRAKGTNPRAKVNSLGVDLHA
jgi:hypothetical protein